MSSELKIGDPAVSYSARGIPSYSVELWHDGLKKHRVIKANDPALVQQKLRLQIEEWEARWQRTNAKELNRISREDGKRHQEERKADANERTLIATADLDALGSLLTATLAVDDTVAWESLKDRSPFPEPPPRPGTAPRDPTLPPPPIEPQQSGARYLPALGFFDKIIPARKRRIETEMSLLFQSDHRAWRTAKQQYELNIKDIMARHAVHCQRVVDEDREKLRAWELRRDTYLKEQADGHALIDERERAYFAGETPAVVDYCDLVLASSSYPECFPQEYELQYNASTKTLIVDYKLLSPDDVPTLKAVRYVAARDSFEESHITEAQRQKLFDDIGYQVALRTLHELFESDTVNAINAAVFNGIVEAIDRKSGKLASACIMSVAARKAEFLEINLAQVEPKACFKALKGIASAKLSGLVPVPPIMQMSREDGRFIAAYEVASSLNAGVNLAAMDWEDFEHLIREIFEKEFSTGGGEVKVTRASRDGGVDAVAFDPDPIRGGRIVIQAKRWTGTVGVGAVRDLYGTVMSEGANKGILVTTSDYGPDSYAFANGKPLVLINGANLLHMLAKHGHAARIDIAEARKLL